MPESVRSKYFFSSILLREESIFIDFFKESDLQSKKLHGLVYQLERDIETLRTQTAVSTTIEDEPLQPRLSVIEDPEGVPYSLPKILCECCSAFNKDKKGDSTVESVEKLKRKIASLQGKHFEVHAVFLET